MKINLKNNIKMKTLKNITLTAVLIIVTANVSMANNYITHRILIPAGKVVEIFSIIESPLKEIIPGYENIITETRNNNIIDVNDIEIYVEAEVEEYLPVFAEKQGNDTSNTYSETLEFIKTIYAPEKEVDDLPFEPATSVQYGSK